MIDYDYPTTDLRAHHIEGMLPDGRQLKIPLISEIQPNLWMGGCIDGVHLPEDFGFVLSLYPWEKYVIGPETERQETRLYDSAKLPDAGELHDLAALVNERRAQHKTLVHCQAGLNRSGLVTALALMLGGGSAEFAINLLREKRDHLVLCNQAFERWLHDTTLATRKAA